jgi:hypothetical protein
VGLWETVVCHSAGLLEELYSGESDGLAFWREAPELTPSARDGGG